jgi:putative CocE/NonD family hydrolase
LGTQPPVGTAAPSSFVFDPANPVPTIGGRYALGAVTPLCAQDQVCSPKILGCSDSKPLKERPDVLSFSTPPLESPVEATGTIRAKLWISSDAEDTDFTAKLVDVYPSGYALILTDGQIRARFRKSFERPAPLKPGRVYEVMIDLGPTSNLFAPGHRIRVDISSSNFPRFEPLTRKARNAVYHDARRPSYIELPVIR